MLNHRSSSLQAFATAAAQFGCGENNAVAKQASQATEQVVAKALSSSGQYTHAAPAPQQLQYCRPIYCS